MANIETVATSNYPVLINGTAIGAMTKVVTVVSGAGKLAKGTVLGKVKASGKYNIADASKSDGTESAKVILNQDVDATSADVNAEVYITGVFNTKALIVASGDTVAAHEDELHLRSIFLSAVVA